MAENWEEDFTDFRPCYNNRGFHRRGNFRGQFRKNFNSPRRDYFDGYGTPEKKSKSYTVALPTIFVERQVVMMIGLVIVVAAVGFGA